MNQPFPSLHGGIIEITLTVPLNNVYQLKEQTKQREIYRLVLRCCKHYTIHFIRVVIIIDNKISIDLIGFEVDIYLMIKDHKSRFKYSPGLVLA